MNEMHLEFLASDGWAKMLDTLGSRLEAVGFTKTQIDVGEYQFRFRTRKG